MTIDKKRKRRKVGEGGKRRVLLAGEYPLLPTGRLWFELILVTGYEGVQHEDVGAIEEALESGLETVGVPLQCDPQGEAVRSASEGDYRAPEQMSFLQGGYQGTGVPAVDAPVQEAVDLEPVWLDTEPPAPEKE